MSDYAALLDLAALVLAIFLLLQLQRVRAVLSLVFAPTRARRIAAPRIPEAIADLHAQAAAELAPLGFEGPQWFLVDSPGGTTSAQPVAVWRQREEGDALWLYAPPGPQFANRLLSVFVRRLADGRHCVSQAFDCYAEVCANEQVLGQTIAGADFAAQWKRHRDWAQRQGAADPAGVDDAALEWQAGGLAEQRLASLEQRGKVYRDSQDLLRPRLGFAWTIYRAFRRQPKPPANTQPVPPARLAWLAGLLKRHAQQSVPRRVQAGLFAFSVALFLLLGGWIWGWRFAAILLVVVAIHESGHYLAMRLSGYRNVQMLALPLVGGVTMGHEARPDAARRAWMSLMGPLPGILIGWALLAYAFFSGGGIALGGAGGSLVVEAAFVFLFVNYLNVLPVPPLDGAHVVQELLPVGSARLSAVFIAVASVAGAALAFWLGFRLLAFIAVLQLSTVRSRWQLGGVLRALRDDPQMDKSQPEAQRQRRLFEAFDRIAGTTALAPPRLALAGEALRSLDVTPMRPLQRVLVGGTYLLLLAGPLAAAVIAVDFWQSVGSNDFDAVIERQTQDRARLEADAAKLDMGTLVADLLADEREGPAAAAPAPADESAIAAAQARLGMPLPDELIAFYRTVDGAESLGLSPLAQVQRVSEVHDLDLDSFAVDGKIPFYRLSTMQVTDAGTDQDYEVNIAPAQLRQCLLLGRDGESATALLYDAGTPPQQPGLRLYRLDLESGNPTAPRLLDWLRQRWAMHALSVEERKRFDAARQGQRAALAGQTSLQLLDALPRPPLWQRLLSPQLNWPGPADEAQISAVATRLGAPLPEELAALYRRHDGLQTVQLLPLAQWRSVATLDPGVADMMRRRYVAAFGDADTKRLSACIAIAGFSAQSAAEQAASPTGIRQLWCPGNEPQRRFLDLVSGRAEADYSALLREHVAQLRAMDKAQAEWLR